MKKVLNFRPFVLFALSIVVGIVLSTFVFVSLNLKLVFLLFFALLSICSIILLIVFKAKFLKYLVVCLLLITLPIGQYYGMHRQMNKNYKHNETEVLINGRICENFKFTSSGNLSFEIDDVTLVGANFKEKINGSIAIYTNPENYDLEKLEVGRFVSVFGKIRINHFEENSKYLLSNLSNNVIGSCYANYSSVTIKNETDRTLDESARLAVWNKLQSFDIEYAEIGYAMMFGDASSIDEDVVSAFRTTGIAHLLAVSGLHVSIIVMMISFILKLCKVSKRLNVAIVSVILLIYCYLCNFSVSVVRASLMSLLYLFLLARGKCYDRLSALAFSMCIILAISPLKLFNVSLILSFMAVFSITILTKVFEDLFEKCFHKKLSATLALIFAVQVGLVFVQLYFFKNYTPMSIICNFISIPVATMAFVVLIISTIVSSILPFMSFSAKIYDYLMGLVVKFNYTLSKLPLIISVSNLNFWIIIFGTLLMVLLSGFIFIKKRYKAVGVSLFAILCTILLFVWVLNIKWTRQIYCVLI